MKRRAFTLVELLFASAIGAMVLMSLVMMIGGVWTLVKESSDELQCVLRARSLRERLLYSATDYGGLVGATNVVFSSSGFDVYFPESGSERHALGASEFSLDTTVDSSRGKTSADVAQWLTDDCGLYRVFFTVSVGKSVYRDRMIVPVYGKRTKVTSDLLQ